MAFQIVKIPDLPVASSIQATDRFPIETASGTMSVTQSVVDSYNNGKYLRKDVNETTTGTITAAGLSTASSRKFKDGIVPLEKKIIEKVLKLVPSRYTYKKTSPIRAGEKDIGLIAEDVLPLIPEVVVTASNGDPSIAYDKLSVFLLLALQDLTERIEKLEQ